MLPISRAEALERGWDELDFVLISGDAYVDHPSFGAALIARVLEDRGYRIGILPQPDWRDAASFQALGRPRLAFLVTAGNVDSMVAHFSAARHRRQKDAYSPGGRIGLRPDRATLVYSGLARQAYKGVPLIIGGLEASLRRLSHYDYWSDRVRGSILVDAKADILVYGMGERQIVEIAGYLERGIRPEDMPPVRGTAVRRSTLEGLDPHGYLLLPSHQQVCRDKRAFADSFLIQYRNSEAASARTLVEPCPGGYVVQQPPALPLSREELDRLYELPYTRQAHPVYLPMGGVPALEEVRFSLTSVRGCFGGCSFCALAFHQGRLVQSRSHESLLREARLLTRLPGFKGYLHDVGGPTANFRQPACPRQAERGSCRQRGCLAPEPCPNLVVDHSDYLALLSKLRSLPGVKKVFIRSGIRHDYLMADADQSFLRQLCRHHVSGQLKVAPEHVSPRVLRLMGKPGRESFDRFLKRYRQINKELGREQYLVPYLISGHPGSGLQEAIELAEYLRDSRLAPEQVQDFYPTPGTLSTCMFWTGLDPRSGRPVAVARGLHDKALQRALIQFRDPRNHRLVKEALQKAGRPDLIGHGRGCLIPPYPQRGGKTGR